MYHGRIAINPLDDNLIYVIAREYAFSNDGGKTFHRKPWGGAGGDDHDLWISPKNKDVFYTATDQGAHLTEDGGKTFLSFTNMAIGQYYAIGVDMREPYWIYGGLQDNGGWAIPSNSRDRMGIMTDHCIEVNGGDGFHMQADPDDWRNVYTTCHVGGFGRVNMETREHKLISPLPETIVNYNDYYDPNFPETPIHYSIDPGEHWLWWQDVPQERKNSKLGPQFRFNWSSPLIISPNDSKTVYVGGNYVFKSNDQGNSWKIISPDLTTNDPQKRNSSKSGGLTAEVTGAENHCTIITLSESSLDANILWAGTDDGNIQVTIDGGKSWSNVVKNIAGLPQNTWCSRVEASHFEKGTAYATFDGHRNDDFKPYVYKTTDYGKNWDMISKDIPDGNCVYVIKEDHKNKNLLFIGTEFGCYVTINGGKNWSRFMNYLPTVAVHDLVIHPRDNDLIAGTHGRSIWIVDDITPLQQMTEDVINSDLFLFQSRAATKWYDLSMGRVQPYFKFRGQNPPSGALIHFYCKSTLKDKVTIVITNVQDPDIEKKITANAKEGLNVVRWDFNINNGPMGYKVKAGEYNITLKAGDKTLTGKLTVKDD